MSQRDDTTGGNIMRASWVDNDIPTLEEIMSYKAAWKRNGFPNTVSPNAKEHEGNINDPSYALSPEATLWQQVLVESLADIVKGRSPKATKKDLELAEGAIRWVKGDGNDEFGFIWTCEILGLEPSYVLKYLENDGCIAKRGVRRMVISYPQGDARKPIHEGT